MAISLVIFEGPTPAKAKPILATRDPQIIAAVKRLILERLSDGAQEDSKMPNHPQKI